MTAPRGFRRFFDLFQRVIERLLILLVLMLLGSVALQVVARYIPFIPRFLWTLEVSNFSLIWAVFLGASLAVRENTHFFVELVPERVVKRFPAVFRTAEIGALLLMALLFAGYGTRFFLQGTEQTSQFTGINLGFIYFVLPFTGLIWLVFLAEKLIYPGRKEDR